MAAIQTGGVIVGPAPSSASSTQCYGCTVIAQATVASTLSDNKPTSYFVVTAYRVSENIPDTTGSSCLAQPGTVVSLSNHAFSFGFGTGSPAEQTRAAGAAFFEVIGTPTCVIGSITGHPGFLIEQQFTSQFDPFATATTLSASSISTTPRASTISSTQSSSVQEATVSSTSQPTATSTSAPATSDDGLTIGAKIGVGIGVSFAVIMLALASAAVILIQRRQTRGSPAPAPASASASSHNGSEASSGFAAKPELGGVQRHEIGSGDIYTESEMEAVQRNELPAAERYELDAKQTRIELRAEEVAREKD